MDMAVRQEIHSIIDNIPEHNLYILRPLLDFPTEKSAANDSLSDEETELLEQCRRDRREHPENFISWAETHIGVWE